MSPEARGAAAAGLRVFISSPSKEMASYRSVAKAVIRDLGMAYVAYDDPDGIAPSQSEKDLMDLGRDTVTSCDVLLGLYGVGPVWAPARDPYAGPELCRDHPELEKDPDKLMIEYEYEWAREANLYTFLFLRTETTTRVPPVPDDPRMERFSRQLRARTVGWLSTPDAFRDRLQSGLTGIRPRVFMSYSRANVEMARDLQRALRREDIHAWRDEASIPGGEEWQRAIDSALSGMDVMVVMITPESLASEWVEKECLAFVQQGKTLIPFLVDPGCRARLPEYLATRQYINASSQGVEELAKRLRSVLDGAVLDRLR